jgi:hypothetical protein
MTHASNLAVHADVLAARCPVPGPPVTSMLGVQPAVDNPNVKITDYLAIYGGSQSSHEGARRPVRAPEAT